MTEKLPAWAEVQVAIDRLRPWGRFLLRTVYEREDFPRDAVFSALPGFEYPDWDYSRIRDLIDHAMHENKHRRAEADAALRAEAEAALARAHHERLDVISCPRCKSADDVVYAEYVLHSMLPWKMREDGTLVITSVSDTLEYEDCKEGHFYCKGCGQKLDIDMDKIKIDFE